MNPDIKLEIPVKLEMNTLIAILPNFSRDNHSDNSTLVGEDTVDEGIIVLQKKKKTGRIFYIKGRKRNGCLGKCRNLCELMQINTNLS